MKRTKEDLAMQIEPQRAEGISDRSMIYTLQQINRTEGHFKCVNFASHQWKKGEIQDSMRVPEE